MNRIARCLLALCIVIAVSCCAFSQALLSSDAAIALEHLNHVLSLGPEPIVYLLGASVSGVFSVHADGVERLAGPGEPGLYFLFFVDYQPALAPDVWRSCCYAYVEIRSASIAIECGAGRSPDVSGALYQAIPAGCQKVAGRTIVVADVSRRGAGPELVAERDVPEIRRTGSRHALVIDAGDKNGWLFTLADNSCEHANGMAAWLTDQGFLVQRISQYWDSSHPHLPWDDSGITLGGQLLREIVAYKDVLREGDEFFLYINAHGDKDGCAIYEATGSGRYESVEYAEIALMLAHLPDGVGLTVFIDACSSGGAVAPLKTLYKRAGLVTILTSVDDDSLSVGGQATWISFDSATEDFLQGRTEDRDGDGKVGDIGDCIDKMVKDADRLSWIYSYNPQVIADPEAPEGEGHYGVLD